MIWLVRNLNQRQLDMLADTTFFATEGFDTWSTW